MLGFVIWSIAAILFFLIGISGWKAQEAVGFFTFVKSPIVTDVTRYNHQVSILWMVSAVILEIMGIPFLFLEQNSPLYILMIFGVVILIIGMIITYIRIESKYKI